MLEEALFEEQGRYLQAQKREERKAAREGRQLDEKDMEVARLRARAVDAEFALRRYRFRFYRFVWRGDDRVVFFIEQKKKLEAEVVSAHAWGASGSRGLALAIPSDPKPRRGCSLDGDGSKRCAGFPCPRGLTLCLALMHPGRAEEGPKGGQGGVEAAPEGGRGQGPGPGGGEGGVDGQRASGAGGSAGGCLMGMERLAHPCLAWVPLIPGGQGR